MVFACINFSFDEDRIVRVVKQFQFLKGLNEIVHCPVPVRERREDGANRDKSWGEIITTEEWIYQFAHFEGFPARLLSYGPCCGPTARSEMRWPHSLTKQEWAAVAQTNLLQPITTGDIIALVISKGLIYFFK
jgi:hypothetical protein